MSAKSNDKKILLTGGAGYIGAVQTRELLQRGFAVRVFDKLYFGPESLNGSTQQKIELVQGDVRQFDDRVLDGIDAVIHMGSLSNDPTAEFDPKSNHAINCEGTLRVAEACIRKGVKRFTFASSCAITGFHVEGIADESYPANPQSEYAQSKLDAEEGLKKLAGKNGFCPVILRQATVFGFSPRMRWDLVVNTMTKDAYDKGRIYVYSAGDNWRPLVHVKDVADAHIAAIEAPSDKVSGEVFHLVHQNYRILELGHWVKECLKAFKPDVIVEVLFGTKESRSYRISGEKMKRVLGFEPKRTVQEAVSEIYEILQGGRFTDFGNPIYYNVEWMKLLVQMEERLKQIGKVL